MQNLDKVMEMCKYTIYHGKNCDQMFDMHTAVAKIISIPKVLHHYLIF